MNKAEQKFKYNYTVKIQDQITDKELAYDVNFDLEGNVFYVNCGLYRWDRFVRYFEKDVRDGHKIISEAKKQRDKAITNNYISMKVKQGNRLTDNLKQGGR